MLPQGPYDPTKYEKEILDFWLSNQFYKPEFNPELDKVVSTEEMKKDSRVPFSIICPPPNAYARPHIGNLSGYAYQDAMGRFARMQGKKVLLVPGKDHAGLEGEGVFVREVLEKKKIDKFSLSREEFYKMIWDFNMENKEKALKDEQDIGLSADFERDIFTLDPKIVDIVLSTFVEMHNDDMIYKGTRIINWDPKARSTLADNQCIREEREGTIYYIKYFFEDNKDEFLTVATTRPETMFGDTAVAINPTDERFQGFVGRKVIIPQTEISIPVISSHKVEKDFGTGCLKITPAHALDDYLIMMEWNQNNPDKEIGYCNVIGKDLKLVGPVPEQYKGQNYKKILPQIIEDLEKNGFLVKTEKLQQNILISERTKAIVEPMMSSQWFIDIEKIRQPVIDMVKSGKVKIHPKNMEDKFFFWMENLRDWAISRSLWWGYRMPVWYAGSIEERIDENGQVESYIDVGGNWEKLDTRNETHMKVQLESPGESWIQDENVLDTWFSSGQWPFATLTTFDLMDTFYPTDVMETGYDILENWVSRMMMFSWFKLKEIPFKDVYLHGLVKGTDGQKMSKSKGNLVNIDEVKSKYGTDSVRMVYFYQNTAGTSYAMTYEKLDMFKNFHNKLWNASKFVLMNLDSSIDGKRPESIKIELSEKILKHLDDLKSQVTKNIESFQFGLATYNLYHNFWHEFCDIYIEESKKYLNTFKNKETGEIISEPKPEEKLEMQAVMVHTLKEYLKMMHPFIPFITEKIWQDVPKNSTDFRSLMYTKW